MPDLWQRAESEGWIKAAALCIALCDRWRRPSFAALTGAPDIVSPDLLETAASLLAKPASARHGDNSGAKMARHDLSALDLTRRAWAKRGEYGGPPGYARWLWGRLWGGMAAHLNARSRERLQAMAALEEWLAAR